MEVATIILSSSPFLLNKTITTPATFLLHYPTNHRSCLAPLRALNTNDASQSPTPPPPKSLEIRIRRGSRKRAREQQQQQDLNGSSGLSAATTRTSPPPPKDWDSMTIGEKAVELYMGEKGLLFWLNKFAYASIFVIVGGWILFRFVGPSLGLYQLDSSPLSPSTLMNSSS